MQYLVIYESIEGQTRKIAHHVEQRLQTAGHSVSLFNAADKTAPLSFAGYDRIVLAASVHERRHPQSFEVLVAASQKDLAAKPTLMISVSLKAAFDEGHEEAWDYLTEMEMRTKFIPTEELLVAGAVRAGSYDYFESQIVKNVVLKGESVTLDKGVHEFTDWAALDAKIDAFMS
ncbi:Protoporphyrinogen IX dehydrogenase [menaquinone] [Roseovarius albus]|uniref:Protoporphyrinogen IX dehydrogenase [menaquinone] n=1 Tax=Roseovarius albus TaxID=1247867 RepID=A0A1X6YYC2_9RHOB|nr:flavodoxin domain-containing protein [Roseovarius albus]SLN34428.1 Protoporphyrinogen IX dehydrogenase [menaquinone] [Roseovarius albus]